MVVIILTLALSIGMILVYYFVEVRKETLKMKGAIQWIEAIEKAICDKQGTEKTHDGGKGISLDALQNAQKKFPSLVFTRVYLVPIKAGPRMMVTHTKFRFYYDYREGGFGELIVNEEYIKDIEKRIPAIVVPIHKLVEGQQKFNAPGVPCPSCTIEMDASKKGNGDNIDMRCPACSNVIK